MLKKFGESLHERHGSRHAYDISQRMRQLAKLTKQINSVRNGQPPLSLDQCLCGNKFDEVIAAAQALCVFNEKVSDRPLFTYPSLGLKLPPLATTALLKMPVMCIFTDEKSEPESKEKAKVLKFAFQQTATTEVLLKNH